MYEDVIEIVGKEAGPTSIVLAGVHGNERCGVEAVQKLLPELVIEAGRVFFAYGNPRAILAGKRFVDADLNRMFKSDTLLSLQEKESYEYERAQFLKSYLDQAGALLDVHASGTPVSKPFIICEANAKGAVEYLPVDLVVSGFDHVEPGGTDYYMNSIGKVGICLECGYLGDPKSTDLAVEGIHSFLRARGHVSGIVAKKEQSYIRMYEIYMTKTNSFNLVKSFNDFESVAKGQCVGLDGETPVYADRDGIILFAGDEQAVGQEAFLLGERTADLI